MAQDEKNGSEQLLNYIRGYIPLTDETLKTIENLTFINPILIIGMDKEKVEHAVKYIHTTFENPYLPDNSCPSLNVETITQKVHPEKMRSDNVMQCVVYTINEINKEDHHKTILKKYFDKRETELKNYSCIGKNESEIENALFLSANALIKHYQDEILFVKGLKSQRILERLADTFSSIRFGVLIINVPGLDIVSQEFKDQFEVIDLKPESQSQNIKETVETIQPALKYNWSIIKEDQICSNGKPVIQLSKLQLEVFTKLKENLNKFVKKTTLEKCWDKKPAYDRFLSDHINRLDNKLKKGFKQKGIKIMDGIIEPKADNTGKHIAYKLKP